MAKDVTLSLRIDRKLSDKLERQARRSGHSKSAVAARAIENFFEIQARTIDEIKSTLAKARAGGPFVANEDVMRWLESWGTENELPPPKATIKF